jgi:TIR domain-containing protein
MRVFISWSGELSRQLGEAFRNWIPSALQYVKPYFTPADIDKGAKWASEIFKELSGATVCIIILTRENLTSNWIMFEAGAISSTVVEKTRVCPIIFDMEPTDLQGPLSQFQITRFLKADIQKLFHTINSLAGENKLDEAIANSVFEKWWPDLEGAIKKILEGHTASPNSKKIRSDRDLIEEILLLLRSSQREPARAAPYEGSPTHALVRIVDDVITELFDASELHPKLVELREIINKRIPQSPYKDLALRDVDDLIERTKPPPPKRTARKVVATKDDDDIPF